MSDINDIEWVLWTGTIGFETPVPERLAAAVAGDYSGVSISPVDVFEASERGIPATELRKAADDSGLRWIMDPIMNWHPVQRPSGLLHARFSSAEVLHMCEDLGARSMSAIASSTTSADTDSMASGFAGLCNAAADIGASVHLEFMPMSAVPDLKTAWQVVEGADRPNGGLTFDTWHFFRSAPDVELLATIPGERILAVQVDDAAAEIQGTLWYDTGNRLLPGDGSFDLDRVLKVLAANGALRLVGPEVISPFMTSLPSPQAAVLARERVQQALDRAATASNARDGGGPDAGDR